MLTYNATHRVVRGPEACALGRAWGQLPLAAPTAQLVRERYVSSMYTD